MLFRSLSFRLLPPLSPAFRTRRLLALTLRDLRRLATGRVPGDWEGHIYGRLSAMPDAATPLQRAMLMAALSVGSEIIQLRISRTGSASALISTRCWRRSHRATPGTRSHISPTSMRQSPLVAVPGR